MELRHRLVRQTIDRAVSKAMEDMAGNTGRSIRKLIGLGQMFAQGENQKWFFNCAREAVSNPKNSYNHLMARLLADVDGETVRTVGLNLGYSSLIYGARKLRKQQKSTEEKLPWMVDFDFPDSVPADFPKIEDFIRTGREAGIYSYVFHPREPDDVAPLCAAATEFGECFFAFQAASGLVTEQAAVSLGALHNAAVCVEVAEAGFADENCVRAFRLLRKRRCFYGFDAGYGERSRERVICPEFIAGAVSCGCIFGVFRAGESISAPCGKAAYDFIKKERNGTGLPLVTLEWDRDLEEISRRIRVPAGCRRIRMQP